MTNDILILAEHTGGKIKKYSFELAGVAKGLAGTSGGAVHALVIGKGIGDAAKELAQYGVSKIHVADADVCDPYNAEVWTRLLGSAIAAVDPKVVLGTASPLGKDVLPRAAARAGADIAQDCTGIELAGDHLKVRRPYYAGKVFADAEWTTSDAAQFATVRPNSFAVPDADASASPDVASLPVDIDAGSLKYRTKEIIQGESDRPDLTEAPIIVSGGRAMKNADNFKILWELADAIGPEATVGASRAAVDNGYAPHAMQVGQTGKTVSPKLYIAFGISGAIQHLAGMRTSKVIVAVNTDKDAPIFEAADYGIVADLYEVVPLLTEQIKKLLAE